MLQIRPEQMAALEQTAWRRFEDEMIVHSKAFSPRLCAVIGDAQLRVAVHTAIVRARGHGFTNRGPIRLFVELALLCGSAFDTDPQYAAAGAVLREGGDQMQRAQRLHEGQRAYLDQVSGPGASNVHAALERLAVFARTPWQPYRHELGPGLLQAMHRLFPQRADYIGDEALAALIDEACAEALRHALPEPRGPMLIAVLMFSFGHGCTADPLYPWIERTLVDEHIANPVARTARLEKKSLTWLQHVTAANRQGTNR